MADKRTVIQGAEWSEMFSFPKLFKSFSMAVHPPKILLALAGLILIFAAGKSLDALWGLLDQQVQPNAIVAYANNRPAPTEKMKRQNAASLLADWTEETVCPGKLIKHMKKQGLPYVLVVSKDEYEKRKSKLLQNQEREKAIGKILAADDDVEEMVEEADDKWDKVEKTFRKAIDKLDDGDDIGKANLALGLYRQEYYFERRNALGVGVFDTFVNHELVCLHNMVKAVLEGNFAGRAADAPQLAATGDALTDSITEFHSGIRTNRSPNHGVVYHLLLAADGFRWLVLEHWVFAGVFLLWSLVVWALFGGAIYRIAAVEFTRDQKITISQAFAFSMRKFLSFLAAPLAPVLVIGLVGAIIMLVATICSGLHYVFVGGLLYGILYGLLLLLGGLAMAFLSVGLLGGWPLLYPTIAIEGSDYMDALSRSYSYTFAQPWRMAFYGVLAIAYGAITYLFVRLFIFLALLLTWWFSQAGAFGGGNAAGDWFQVSCAQPEFWNFHLMNNLAELRWDDHITMRIIAVWTCLLGGVAGAYLLSYLASCSTVIFCLIRRKVDSTELSDIYLEEEVEQEDLTVTPATKPEETPAEETPKAEEAPAAAPPEAEETPAEKPAEKPSATEEPKAEEPAKPEKKSKKAAKKTTRKKTTREKESDSDESKDL